MEIQKTTAISGISAHPDKPPKDLSNLLAGAVLNAVVAGKTDQTAYLLKLIDGSLIRAQTLNELAPGQQLKLEVVKAGAVPELKIVALAAEHAEPPDAVIVQNALRQLLPKQVELRDLTAVLTQAAGLPGEKHTPVSAAIQSTLATLPTKQDMMTAEGVKQAIADSGVFLEAKLAQQISPHGDIKGRLLVLADALRQALSDQADDQEGMAKILADTATAGHNQILLSKTEGAIARITLDQLTSLPHPDETQNSWQISLPFTDGSRTDTVGLKIKREDSHNPAQPQAGWSITLELKPPGLAPLQCKISLHDAKVDTYFWSDADPELRRVQDNLDLLAQRYADAGLIAGHLNVVDGARMHGETREKTELPAIFDDFA